MKARTVDEFRDRSVTDLGVTDASVDEAITLAGGDPRDAIRGLILGQRQIEAELRSRISAGYVRGRE